MLVASSARARLGRTTADRDYIARTPSFKGDATLRDVWYTDGVIGPIDRRQSEVYGVHALWPYRPRPDTICK